MPPYRVFEQANKHLCGNNEMSMFVTVFLGALELDTGLFTYVNAGHNPPMIKRRGGRYEPLRLQAGFVLGAMEDVSYKQDELTFGPGDSIFLYTDGVTEALNDGQEQFSAARLLETLNSADSEGLDMAGLLSRVKEALDEFTAGAEQADDITMLGLCYRGRRNT
jgi:sigma-B regulation protein RsbU (phosphoserine phosphatase)